MLIALCLSAGCARVEHLSHFSFIKAEYPPTWVVSLWSDTTVPHETAPLWYRV